MLLVSEPRLGEEDKFALGRVIDSRWITMGDQVRAFERTFADHHGVNDAVAVSSCTAGLHLTMCALGIGPGDEVLVPALTFVATVNSVLYVGATPVFVDIDSMQVPHMSLADAASKITERTKAVIIMHYGGYCMDPVSWRAFAESRNLLLIEDAAHVVGVNGVGVDTDAAVFSFYGNKNMTTAEGGMILSRDPAIIDALRRLRSHGMTSTSWDRVDGQTLGYDVTNLGYNYRMDELRAALGQAQLKRLASWNDKRRQLSNTYRDLFALHCPEIQLPFSKDHLSAYHILPAILPVTYNRQAIMKAMHEAGIQTTVHYPPVHLFSYYTNKFPRTHLPTTEEFCKRELTLPLHPGLAFGHVETIVRVLTGLTQ